MNKLDFGKKLQELRKAKGLTQAGLAEILNMHEKHISRIESGKSMSNVENLIKMLTVLDVDIFKITKKDDRIIPKNPIKSRLLKIINNAEEKELKFYLGLIEQAQKGLKAYNSV